MTATKPVMAVP